MIRTINYEILPVARDATFMHSKVIDTIEMDNGDIYEIRQAFSGGLVAIKI